jgi:hypothetical protein
MAANPTYFRLTLRPLRSYLALWFYDDLRISLVLCLYTLSTYFDSPGSTPRLPTSHFPLPHNGHMAWHSFQWLIALSLRRGTYFIDGEGARLLWGRQIVTEYKISLAPEHIPRPQAYSRQLSFLQHKYHQTSSLQLLFGICLQILQHSFSDCLTDCETFRFHSVMPIARPASF